MARKWWTLTVVLAGMFMLGFVSFSTALAALVYRWPRRSPPT